MTRNVLAQAGYAVGVVSANNTIFNNFARPATIAASAGNTLNLCSFYGATLSPCLKASLSFCVTACNHMRRNSVCAVSNARRPC